MSMTDQEQKNLRSYCAFLLTEYGFHFSPDDPVIPALYIIHREMQLNNQNNLALSSQVKEATSRIRPEVFHFNVAGESWKFQVGIVFKWTTAGLIALLFAWVGVWYWSIVKDVDKARIIIESSGSMDELLKDVKKDKSGYFFIDFKLAKGDSILPFTEFRKINSKTVRVYLGKDIKN